MGLELDYQLQCWASLMICPDKLEALGGGSLCDWAFVLHAHSLGRWEVREEPLKRHSLVSGTVMVLQLVWVSVAFTVFSRDGGRSVYCLPVSRERPGKDGCGNTDTTCSCEFWKHNCDLNVLERQKVQCHLGNSKPRKESKNEAILIPIRPLLFPASKWAKAVGFPFRLQPASFRNESVPQAKVKMLKT